MRRGKPGALTFQRKPSARVVLPGRRPHHPRNGAGKGRHSRARRGRIRSRQKSLPVRSLHPCCDLFLSSSFFNLFSLPSPHSAYPPPQPRLQSTLPEAGEGGEVGAEVGRREGGDEEVQTNKHTNPKSASACSTRLEVVRADARGRPGRRGRVVEPSPGNAARVQGPQSGTGERCALALRAKVSQPRGYGVDSFSYLFIYLFSRFPSLPTPLHSSPRLSADNTRYPLTLALTPPPSERLGREEGASRVSGLEGRRQEVTGKARGRVILWVSCAKVLNWSARRRRRRRRQRTRSDRFGLFFYS